MLKKHTTIAMIYFFIIALSGLILRAFPVFYIPVNYKFLVHTHSHIALLGWVYTALITLIYLIFLNSQKVSKKYQIIFWSTQVTILGMLFSFPFTGYALFSIIFSTLFLLASYWFVLFFFKNTPASKKKSHSYKLIRASLWYMVISSIGPWALGIIMNTAGSGSPWYKNAIYFFLHFQYNGWFIVALCGILLYIFEKRSFILPEKTFRQFYYLLNTGVIFTFFLSILWMKPNAVFYLLALTGGILQLFAFGLLFREILSKGLVAFRKLPPLVIFSLRTVLILLVFKLIAQVLGAFPVISKTVFTNLDLVISYIHWVFLGIVSLSLFGFLFYFDLLKLKSIFLYIYLAGFFLTEALIFSRGIVSISGMGDISYFSIMIALSSIIIFIAITGILINQFFTKNYKLK